MSKDKARATTQREVVVPGALLSRALHLLDRPGHERAHSVGVLVGLAFVVFALVVTLSAVIGACFLVGAGGSWLHEHVEFFEHHPRLGPLLGAWILGCFAALCIIIGRMTVGGRRPR
jgi:hypothetical protein